MELIIVALIPVVCVISWFRGQYFIKTLDSLFGFNHFVKSYYCKYIWKDWISFGVPFPDQNSMLLHEFLNALLNAFGLYLGQKVAFYIFIASSILSFWLFLFMISREVNHIASFARIVASLFYTFNLFSISFFWWHHMGLIIYWIAFPILFLSLHRLVISEKIRIIDYLTIPLISTLFASAINPLSISISLFAFTIYVLMCVLMKVNSFKVMVKRILEVFVLTLLINTWYLLPQLITLKEQLIIARGGITNPEVSIKAFEYASRYTTLLNVLGLRGNKLIYVKYMTDYYYNWAPVYIHNTFMI
ncbi:MAG: hypothetical protein DRP01_11100, partial [Archaeoglobales archaeon]